MSRVPSPPPKPLKTVEQHAAEQAAREAPDLAATAVLARAHKRLLRAVLALGGLSPTSPDYVAGQARATMLHKTYDAALQRHIKRERLLTHITRTESCIGTVELQRKHAKSADLYTFVEDFTRVERDMVEMYTKQVREIDAEIGAGK